MSSTVLIASPRLLALLQQRGELGDALAFNDGDALRAFDAIARERPHVIAIEDGFAATPHGTAFLDRVKADPALASCEIRVIAQDGKPRPGRRAAEAAAAERPASGTPYRGTRRAARVRVLDGVEVLVDGSPAVLIDVSTMGAQVVSPTILKPNQRVRISLPDSTRPIRFNAGVAWAAFEMPRGIVRYRAGLEFLDADPAALARFIEICKK